MASDYKTIRQLLYMKNSTRLPQEEAEDIYNQRIAGPATFDTNITFDNRHRIFVTMFKKMSILSENIFRQEKQIDELWGELPGLAQQAYVYGLLINELMSTNAIEGVRSTRKEIGEALLETNSPQSTKRFAEFARLYSTLTDNTAKAPALPHTLQDIRNIYDQVTKGEISKNNLPDGKLFRAGTVLIQDEANGNTIHDGIFPEMDIQVKLTGMLDFMNDDDVPLLLRAVMCHYMFEYIHPFYDGNGRTGRYLLALQLRDCLSVPTAISISPVISENKSAYYKAFEEAENPLNCSEISFFAYRMMKLISSAQKKLVEDLGGKWQSLQTAWGSLEKLKKEKQLDQTDENILSILIQEALFRTGPSMATRRQHIMPTIKAGWKKTNVHLERLIQLDLVEGRGRRNTRYSLTEKASKLLLESHSATITTEK